MTIKWPNDLWDVNVDFNSNLPCIGRTFIHFRSQNFIKFKLSFFSSFWLLMTYAKNDVTRSRQGNYNYRLTLVQLILVKGVSKSKCLGHFPLCLITYCANKNCCLTKLHCRLIEENVACIQVELHFAWKYFQKFIAI